MKLVARDSMLGVSEAAKAMGVSVSTVWRLLRKGALKSVRKSGRRLISERELISARAQDIDKVPPFSFDSPMWRLVGAGRSGGQGPGSDDKHFYEDE